MKITRNQRKLEHMKWLKLKSEIPEHQYCGRCPHKRYTAPITDYAYRIKYDGEITTTKIKVMRRRVYCNLNKRRSLDDLCMSDGLKVCGINEYD